MQLTNILRDVGEDFRLGRIYLPADEMAAHGVTPDDLAATGASPALKSLLRAQAGRAREYYRRAEVGTPLLADDGSQFTVWLMRHVYAGILDEIERQDYEVLRQRASTSFGRKLRLARQAWTSSVRCVSTLRLLLHTGRYFCAAQEHHGPFGSCLHLSLLHAHAARAYHLMPLP